MKENISFPTEEGSIAGYLSLCGREKKSSKCIIRHPHKWKACMLLLFETENTWNAFDLHGKSYSKTLFLITVSQKYKFWRAKNRFFSILCFKKNQNQKNILKKIVAAYLYSIFVQKNKSFKYEIRKMKQKRFQTDPRLSNDLLHFLGIFPPFLRCVYVPKEIFVFGL